MRNFILIGLGLAVVASMFSCKSNHICPSFESAYILDQQIRDQTFSLFDADTLPREDYIVRKDKNGIIKSVKYKKKRDQLLTVKMETIFPQVEPPDTLLLAEQDLSPEQIEEILSEGERPVDRYNVDQIYYMRHFGQYLPMPEEPGTRVEEEAPEDEETLLEEPKEKKRKKWQFWKKKEPAVEESDSIDYGFEEEQDPFEDFDDDDVQKEKLSKKELRQLEQQEKREQEEVERLREPAIIDLEDFEKNRDDPTPTAPMEEKGIFKKKKQDRKSKGEKKIKLGFGKKKKQTESVEIIEER